MEENAENNTIGAACRLCDQISETVLNVFEKTEDGTQILHLIKENLPIIIYRTDPLSKVICQKCLNTLDSVDKFRKISQATQEKYKKNFRNSTECSSDAVRLYLGFDSNFSENGEDIDEELKDACTSTDDLTILCSNCKQTILDGSFVNGEVELCADLHNAIAESLRKNRLVTETDSEKVLRKRKVQPLYQEFDDSLCSSLTEFTRHTELDDENFSQCGYETHSDVDSEESDNERPKKRQKLDETPENNDQEVQAPLVAEDTDNTENEEKQEDYKDLVEKFKQEPDVSYEPLSLLCIALNAINCQNVPEYTPEHFRTVQAACACEHCGESFQNVKLLALHEPTHIFVEIEDKVDQPVPWNESKGDDFKIRNKWLSFFDENGYGEDDIVVDVMDTSGNSANNLLIPHDSKNTNTEIKEGNEIVLIDMKPTVNGIYLGDYTKEERKNFYQCMKVGGQTKRFCQLCRYCFKDNWAIESHYFSLACHYTCRYCGMRFNKQRPRYDEHIKEHVEQKHEVSDKIFAASKVNNFLPKILKPDKIRDPHEPESLYPANMPVLQPQISITSGLRVRNNIGANNRPSPPYLFDETIIKEEPREVVTSQSKTGNQAYFCRKCYKVFFKLDEFNLHSKNCNYNQFPGALRHIQLAMTAMPRNPMPPGGVGNHRRRSPSGDPLATPSRSAPSNRSLTNGSNGDVSNTGRPIRNCAKDVGPYKDEVYIPKELLRETVPNNHAQPQSFVCHICGTPFPTIYSRNSHMRIHKGDPTGMGGAKVRPPAHHQQYQQYPKFAEVKIKQEPLDSFEPMVEIHEGEQKYSHQRPSKSAAPPPPSSLGDGAVSITPIAKKPPATNHSKASPTTATSNVMRLVHNNPHLTIKKPDEKYRVPSGGGAPSGFQGVSQAQSNSAANYVNAMLMDADKSYKCSSCWEAFSNKSHLYFHKKNQCEGSRFPCPFCKKRFGTEAAYSSHIFYSHPE